MLFYTQYFFFYFNDPSTTDIYTYLHSRSLHDARPILSGDGWQTLYLEIAREHVSALNTPKRHNIDAMFLKLIGLADLSDTWSVGPDAVNRSEEHTSDVQSLMRNSYAVFCLKKKTSTISIRRNKHTKVNTV